jgi:hypothetical protein
MLQHDRVEPHGALCLVQLEVAVPACRDKSRVGYTQADLDQVADRLNDRPLQGPRPADTMANT